MIIPVLKIICTTIIICYLIRYICIWNCQSIEYKLYQSKNSTNSPLSVRPFYNKNPTSGGEAYWGYVIYNTEKDEPFTGEGANTFFTVYRELPQAEARLGELNKLYGY